MNIATLVAAAAALLLLAPVLVLSLQVAAAIVLAPAAPAADRARPRVAVLVPAHDEAAGIAATLNSIRAQLRTGDRLLVVADNCSDATADLARAQGAEVLERHDPRRRGKGYALDFGIRHLEADPPGVVVVVDADCALGPGTVDILARQSAGAGRPVQALYLMHAPAGAGLKTRLAEFGWVLKNRVRPLGFHRLGLPCQLMGTGMAFPWPLIAGAALASGHITEDLKLGLDLAAAGTPPLFCPEGLVTSRFSVSQESLATQHTRWEHGHLWVMACEAPRLFLRALRRGDGALLALVLDLAVPPLMLLALLVLTVAGLAATLYGLGAPALALAPALAALAALGLAILAAWWRFGRRLLSFANLVTALWHAVCKTPLYLKFLVNRQVEWIRSKRDEP